MQREDEEKASVGYDYIDVAVIYEDCIEVYKVGVSK
jgi:hypothetical protein